jgi:hypothetical protein
LALAAGAPSVPIPKLARFCRTLGSELRNRRTLASLCFSCRFEPEARNRTRGNCGANFGFAALAHRHFHGNAAGPNRAPAACAPGCKETNNGRGTIKTRLLPKPAKLVNKTGAVAQLFHRGPRDSAACSFRFLQISLVPRTRSSHHNCRESDCELRVQSGTRIIKLLVSFDSEVRSRANRKLRRTSESGH